ncbi:MAG TPA: hypothetical protein VGN26_10775 [Armatimonadota bacterium]
MSIKLARVVGALVFCGGIALLCVVFFSARALLGSPLPGITKNLSLGTEMSLFGARAALLFIMAFCGSSIAGRGAQLFQATFHGAVPPLLPPRPHHE